MIVSGRDMTVGSSDGQSSRDTSDLPLSYYRPGTYAKSTLGVLIFRRTIRSADWYSKDVTVQQQVTVTFPIPSPAVIFFARGGRWFYPERRITCGNVDQAARSCRWSKVVNPLWALFSPLSVFVPPISNPCLALIKLILRIIMMWCGIVVQESGFRIRKWSLIGELYVDDWVSDCHIARRVSRNGDVTREGVSYPQIIQ